MKPRSFLSEDGVLPRGELKLSPISHFRHQVGALGHLPRAPACRKCTSWRRCSSPSRRPQRMIPASKLLSMHRRNHAAVKLPLRG